MVSVLLRPQAWQDFGIVVGSVAASGQSRPLIGWSAVRQFPRLPRSAVNMAVGILGAVIMPHNIYLHSALVQYS